MRVYNKSRSVAERLQEIEDRAELNDLVSRYAIAVDDRNFDSLSSLFSFSCIFRSVEGVSNGRDSVIDYYKKRMAQFGPTYHIPHWQLILELEDEFARGVVLAHAELAIDDVTYIVALRYLDSYVHENGAWCFQEREVSQLYALPLNDLPEAFCRPLRKQWPGTEPASSDWPYYNSLT